jgi:hypothetical protein
MADLHSISHEGTEVSSYTETPDQLRAALGVEQQPTEPPAETPTPESDTDETPAGGEPPAESAAGQTLAKKRRSLQDRIDTITREKYETVRERDDARMQARRLEQELADLKRGNGHPPTTPTPASGAPTPEKFPKYADYLHTHPDAELEDWLEARDTWRDQRHADQTARAHQAETRSRTLTQRTQTFSAKIQAAVQHDPDLLSQVDPRLLQTKPLSSLAPDEPPTFGNFLVEQILASEHPEKLLRHLSNDAEVQRLAALDPDRVIRELARIEYGLGAAPPSGPAPTAVSPSKAHPPVKPLGGSPPQDADAPPGDDADDETHRVYWNQKELARRRRG